MTLIGRDGHGEAVDEEARARDAVSLGFSHDARGDFEPLLGGGGDARLVEREANDVGSVSRGDGQNLVQDLLLAVDGIDDRLAGVPPDGGLERGGDGGVELERQCDGPREAFTGDL